MKAILLGAVLTAGLVGEVQAGIIDQACQRAGRQAASRELCGCIQQAADQVLSRSDQKQAAKFFSDPSEAQKVRQSDRSSHEAFWLRYKRFAEVAETYCGEG